MQCRDTLARPAGAGPAEARPAEDGVAIVDSSLRLIATDRGAIVILADIARYENPPDPARLPREIAAALRETDFSRAAAFRMRLRGERQTYDCRAYLVEARTSAAMAACGHTVAAGLSGAAVAAGVSGMMPSLAPAMLTLHFRRIDSPEDAIRKLARDCNLTPREEEVLTGISQGLTSKELATRLKISPNTVKAFLRSLMIKLNVTTRAGMVGRILKCENGE
jgi:DNA-binding CsgD family transcriptional regulator